ncbi:UNVERIFIED_CONTAM: hypothetical protein Sradi_3010700 [Sesamum radiatum]|uniref:Reverse transcriptase zinc-binding domain-containing protein n=1 Tax=Sesamum radiatum TaxID=300843 RepID=A0AAW2S251_SESRA
MAGIRCQIGYGRHVKIWQDCWIPRPISFRLITIPNSLSLQATVNEIIDRNGHWNVEPIRGIFWPEDVEAILAIPLDKSDRSLLWWHFEKDGRYSVHSGYKLYRSGLVSRAVASSSSLPQLARWNFVWKTPVPPEVSLFIWRVCRNILPTSSNLARRGAIGGGYCPWCGIELEDIFHTLVRCHFARLVWALSHIPWRYIMTNSTGPEIWIRELHNNLDREGFGRALLIYWFLWWTRNKLIFENVQLSADEVMERVGSMETSFRLFLTDIRQE